MSLKKIAEYLFLFFLFLLPFQTVFLLREPFIGGEKWQYGVIGLYVTDIVLLCAVVALVIAQRSWQNFSSPSVYRSLLVFLLWAGLSIFWAGDQSLALSFFVKLLLGAGLFWFAWSFDTLDLRKIIFVLLAAGVIQSGIGIGQFLSQQSIDSSLLGMAAHQASQAGSSVLKIDSGRFLRAYGTFPHPNMLGGFLGVILILGIMHYVSGIKYEKSWKCVAEIAVLFVGILSIFLGLLLTFSRTAWLGVALGIITIGVGSFWQKEREVCVRFLKIVVALGMASLVFCSILFQQIFPRFDTATIEREGSVSERVASFQDAKELIAAHPLFGVGAGNFTAEIMREHPDRPIWSIQPVHNIFALIFAELGVIGLTLFLLPLLSLCKERVCNIIRRSSDYVVFFKSLGSEKNAIFGIGLLVLVPSLFFDHWLWTSHFGTLFFFLLVGLATRREG